MVQTKANKSDVIVFIYRNSNRILHHDEKQLSEIFDISCPLEVVNMFLLKLISSTETIL